jgi:translocation and assembly module TamA
MKHTGLAGVLLATWLAVGIAAPAWSAPSDTATGFRILIEAPDEVEQLLSRHLDLQRYRELTDLSDDELDRLQEVALKDATQLLGTLGFFTPDIHIAREATSAETSASKVIRIQVKPGEATAVSGVQINFKGAIANDDTHASQRKEIQTSWLLPVGQRFTQNDWDKAKQQVLRLLTTTNYPTGHIMEALADVDPDMHQATLSLTLDSGPAFHTGELAIEGLQRYNPQLVRQLAGLSAGRPYRQADLVNAQQRLSDSGYFDSAFVTLDTSDTPDAARILVKLHEAQLQKIVLGVGASTDSGPRLTAEHTYRQVRGIGWTAVSKTQLDRNTRALGTELTSPPDDNNWRWVTSGLVQNQLLGTLDVTSQQLRGGRKQVSERIDRNIYVQYDRAATVNTDVAEPVLAQSISANYAFAVRYYDNLPFPTRGWGWGAEVGGGTTLGGQPHVYTRLLTRWQGFVGLDKLSAQPPTTQASAGRLAMRASFGAVVAQEGINLPSTQLFLAGGDNSVRGYSLHALGVQLADGSTTAGRYMGTASVEWQRPILIKGRPSDWESTLFVDAGAVANQVSELSPKVGVGAGARWKSPVGPLQVDLAYGVDVRRLRLHMNLGFTF